MQPGSLQNITQIRPSLVPKRICGPFYNIMSWASSVHIFLTRHSLTFAYGTTMLSKFSYSPHTNSLQATRSGLLYIALPLTSQYWFSLLVTELVAMKKNLSPSTVWNRGIYLGSRFEGRVCLGEEIKAAET